MVSGIVKSGVVHAGDTVLVGPDSLGQFSTTTIRSIERKRLPVPATSAGQSASFALKRVRRKDVRKGMVVLPKLEQQAPKVYREFVAEGTSHLTTRYINPNVISPYSFSRNNHQDQVSGYVTCWSCLSNMCHH